MVSKTLFLLLFMVCLFSKPVYFVHNITDSPRFLIIQRRDKRYKIINLEWAGALG